MRRVAWGSPFEREDNDNPLGENSKKPLEAMDHEAAVEQVIAKAFKGINTYGEFKILSMDGLVPRKYKAGLNKVERIREGNATVVIEFEKRRAGAPRWASIQVATDREGVWQPPSVMDVEGRPMLICQAIFDDWYGTRDSLSPDHADNGWRGPLKNES